MGEYWCPLNVTRGEYIDPHECGGSYKYAYAPNTEVSHAVEAMFARGGWEDDDVVVFVSDYGNYLQVNGRRWRPDPNDVRTKPIELYSRCDNDVPPSNNGAGFKNVTKDACFHAGIPWRGTDE